MYAKIQAYDLVTSLKNKYYNGKSMWVNDSDFKISLCEHSPNHLGTPPWYLAIYANVEESKSQGSAIIRDLVLQLTPCDLAKLLDFAKSHGLLQVSPKQAISS